MYNMMAEKIICFLGAPTSFSAIVQYIEIITRLTLVKQVFGDTGLLPQTQYMT
jgi:hypothetical protein